MSVASPMTVRLDHTTNDRGLLMRHEFDRLRNAHRSLRRGAHWLRVCPDDEVAQAYVDLLEVTERAFAMEQAMMEQFAFPAVATHLEQHARVLRALHCMQAAVMGGDSDIGRRVGGKLLVEWFQLHHETLDQAVFVWVSCSSRRLADELFARSRERQSTMTPWLSAQMPTSGQRSEPPPASFQ